MVAEAREAQRLSGPQGRWRAAPGWAAWGAGCAHGTGGAENWDAAQGRVGSTPVRRQDTEGLFSVLC